jgi:hypothetical protein
LIFTKTSIFRTLLGARFDTWVHLDGSPTN